MLLDKRKLNRLKRILIQGDVLGLIKILRKQITLFFYKLLYNNNLIIRKVNEYNMYLDIHQFGISGTLAVFRKREKVDTEIVKKELKKGMKVIDIGSNIGYYALLEAGIVGEEGKVYSFEPDPRNIRLLKKNIKLNNFQEIIEFYPLAVSNQNSFQDFYLNKRSNVSSMISSENLSAEETIKVKTIKIDDFNQKDIDFIRMDIEGYEVKAIDGMMNTLRETKKKLKILIELHPFSYTEKEFNFLERLKRLKEIGYSPKYAVFHLSREMKKKLTERGYKLEGLVHEDIGKAGFCRDMKIEDLISLINNNIFPRSILLEKNESIF